MAHPSHVLVTGGAGFIGSHLVDALTGDGTTVTVVDNFDPYYDPSVKRRCLADALASGRATLRETDICDLDALRTIVQKAAPEVIVHLAARAGVRTSFLDPWRYEEVNVRGTLNILEVARECGCAQVIAASSSSVYGNQTITPFSESAHPLTPISPYGATKLAAEAFCRMYAVAHSLPVTSLRFFTVYGPRQRPDMAIAGFTRKILAGEPITLYGDGKTARDYTYVADIVEGIRGAMAHPQQDAVINLGNSTPVPLHELVRTLESVLGVTADIRYSAEQQGDVQVTCADIGLARRLIRYNPAIPLRKGLEHYAAWVKSGDRHLVDAG